MKTIRPLLTSTLSLLGCLSITTMAYAEGDSCLQKAQHYLGNASYNGILNIGTKNWPDAGFASFRFSDNALLFTCRLPNCADGSHYGGTIQVTQCEEASDRIILSLIGPDIEHAAVAIPNFESSVPVPEVVVTIKAKSGIEPNEDTNALFS